MSSVCEESDEDFSLDCDGITFFTKRPDKLLIMRSNTKVTFCPGEWVLTRKYDRVKYKKFAEVSGYEVWVDVPRGTTYPSIQEISKELSNQKIKCVNGRISVKSGEFNKYFSSLRRKFSIFRNCSYIVTLKGQKLDTTCNGGCDRIVEDVVVNARLEFADYIEVDLGVTNQRKTEIALLLKSASERKDVHECFEELRNSTVYWPGNGKTGMNISFAALGMSFKLYNPVAKRHVETEIFNLAKGKEFRTKFMLCELGNLIKLDVGREISEKIANFLAEADGESSISSDMCFPFRTEVTVRIRPHDTRRFSEEVKESLEEGVSIGKTARRIVHLTAKSADQVVSEMLSEIRPWVSVIKTLLEEIEEYQIFSPVKRWLVCLAEDVILFLYDGAFHGGTGGPKPFLRYAIDAELLERAPRPGESGRYLGYPSPLIKLSRSGKELEVSYRGLGKLQVVKDGIEIASQYAPRVPKRIRSQFINAFRIGEEWSSLCTMEQKKEFVLRVVTSDLLYFSYPSMVLLHSIGEDLKTAVIEDDKNLESLFEGKPDSIENILNFSRTLAAMGFRFSDETKPRIPSIAIGQTSWEGVRKLLLHSFTLGASDTVLRGPTLLARRGDFQLMKAQVPEVDAVLDEVKDELAWLPLRVNGNGKAESAGASPKLWVLSELLRAKLNEHTKVYLAAYLQSLGNEGLALLSSEEPEKILGQKVFDNLLKSLRKWSHECNRALDLVSISSINERRTACIVIHSFLLQGPCNFEPANGEGNTFSEGVRFYQSRVEKVGELQSSGFALTDALGYHLQLPMHCGASKILRSDAGHISVARCLYQVFLDFTIHGRKCNPLPSSESLSSFFKDCELHFLYQYFTVRASRGFKIRLGCMTECVIAFSGAVTNETHEISTSLLRELINFVGLRWSNEPRAGETPIPSNEIYGKQQFVIRERRFGVAEGENLDERRHAERRGANITDLSRSAARLERHRNDGPTYIDLTGEERINISSRSLQLSSLGGKDLELFNFISYAVRSEIAKQNEPRRFYKPTRTRMPATLTSTNRQKNRLPITDLTSASVKQAKSTDERRELNAGNTDILVDLNRDNRSENRTASFFSDFEEREQYERQSGSGRSYSNSSSAVRKEKRKRRQEKQPIFNTGLCVNPGGENGIIDTIFSEEHGRPETSRQAELRSLTQAKSKTETVQAKANKKPRKTGKPKAKKLCKACGVLITRQNVKSSYWAKGFCNKDGRELGHKYNQELKQRLTAKTQHSLDVGLGEKRPLGSDFRSSRG